MTKDNDEIGYIDYDIKQLGKQKERLQWQIDDINAEIKYLKTKRIEATEQLEKGQS